MNAPLLDRRQPTSVALPDEVRAAARRAADDANRSLSAYLTELLRRELEREGYLLPTDPGKIVAFPVATQVAPSSPPAKHARRPRQPGLGL